MDALAKEWGGIRKLFSHRATGPLDHPNRSAIVPDVANASSTGEADHVVIFAQKGVMRVFVKLPQLVVPWGVFKNDHPPIHPDTPKRPRKMIARLQSASYGDHLGLAIHRTGTIVS
jgi:hypothetical protein